MVVIDTIMNKWSHLAASNIEELHNFAKLLGLKLEWFQNKEFRPHYDVYHTLYDKAINLGAIPIKRREIIYFFNKYYK